ncbi:MAG TPA: porin family protein [Cytophagales bacterium]|nr:porin family protein [Cytophagales bacterium]
MGFINIWNKLHLLRKKGIILFFLFVFILNHAFAQKYQEINLPNSDNHKLHYGFVIGGHVSKYKLKYNKIFIQDDSIHALKPLNSGGFSIGFLVNKRLGDYFDLRVLPTAGFYENTIKYMYANSANNISKTVEVTYLEIPLLLKYKSERRKNFRMYLVGGIKPAFEVTNKKDDEREHLNIDKTNMSVEYGVGVDIYYPMFKFSPELRFSQGVVDMLSPSGSVYNRPIDVLRTHSVSLYLIFGS